jgi:hypothetical protein
MGGAMSRIAVGCMLAATVALGGCRGEEPEEYPATAERTPYEELATAADTAAEEFRTDETIGVISVQGGRQVPGQLTAIGNVKGPLDNAPPGAVTVTETESGTKLLVSLYGYESGAELQAAFVRGACGGPGEVIEAVEPTIEIPAEGIANFEADLDIPTRPLFDGEHSIRFGHPTEISDGAALQEVSACANLMEIG